MNDWQSGDEAYAWDELGPIPVIIDDPGAEGRTWMGWPTVFSPDGGSPILINPNDLTTRDDVNLG